VTEQHASAADLTTLAKGGSLSLAGSAGGALLVMGLIFVVTVGLGAGEAGAFFEAIALFNIAVVACTLGSDTGLLRFTARNLALEGSTGLRQLSGVALTPVVVVSMLVAVLGLSQADQLARAIGDGAHAATIATYMRVTSVVLPFGALSLAFMGATRGFGTMIPTVVGERLVRPLVQLLLVAAAISVAGSGASLAVSWSLGIVAAFMIGGVWLVALERRTVSTPMDQRPLGEVVREFWAFTLPRALASIFRVGVLWIDIVLVGALISPRAAAIYTVATRLLQAGFLAVDAIGQAVEPMFSSLLSSDHNERAHRLFQVASGWLVGLTWPYFLALWIFAPAVLRIFGAEYVEGTTVVAILAISALVGSGFGPVDVLLVMAGKTTWSFWNSAGALSLNVVLNVVLIPEIGLEGAAIAWAASRLTANILPLIEVRSLLGFHPFGAGWRLAATASLATFGLAGLAARALGGADLPALVSGLLLAAFGYAVLVWRWRDALDLDAFLAMLRPAEAESAT